MNKYISSNGIFRFSDEYLKISIVSQFPRSDIDKPSFGGASLISMQKIYFNKGENDVNMIYLSEIKSVTSYFLALASKARQNSGSQIKTNAARRWFLNILFWIFIDILSRFDLLLKRRLEIMLDSSQSDIVLCNYPVFFNILSSICKKRKIICILCEHNAEYSFYEQVLHNMKIGYPFIKILKMIECSAIKRSDITLAVTSEDRETLLNELGKQYDSRIFYWIPFDIEKEKYTEEQIEYILSNASIEDRQFAINIKNKKIIGFVGAFFEPNIVAVEKIIKLAKSVENESVAFMILGGVCNAFDDRRDIPNNIIMKGFVNNLDFYLSVCYAFINPKTTSDTGIEIKMFDYLKFDKPIISTEIGARGFEEFKNIIISNNTEDISKTILRLYNE